jgi:anti-sigma regulatory factor (Ser/Thr protein kinase)
VSLDLPADFSSVRRARDAVRRVLTGWRADTINDDVVLVASELVANALRHGLGVSRGAGLTPSVPAPAEVRISLVSTGSHVICTVSDPSEAPPVFRDADPLDGSGHGLGLVDSLSLCWGWTVLSPADQRCGKSVWAIFPLGRPTRAVGAA